MAHQNNCESPFNFSWVIVGQLAAMAAPRTSEHLRFLINQNIKHLITLSSECRPPVEDYPIRSELSWTEIAVDEFEAPTIAQMQEFIAICQRAHEYGEGVGVHCRMGRGRTGVMLACYLINFCEQTPERAVINVRLMRPGSVETSSQERAVRNYHDHIRKFC